MAIGMSQRFLENERFEKIFNEDIVHGKRNDHLVFIGQLNLAHFIEVIAQFHFRIVRANGLERIFGGTSCNGHPKNNRTSPA